MAIPNIRKLIAASFFRVLLPAFFVLSFVCRVNLFSLVYMLLFLLHPFVPSPSKAVMRISTKLYLFLTAFSSFSFFTAQAVYAIVLAADEAFVDEYLSCGSDFNQLFRQIGFGEMDSTASWYVYFIYFGPEITIFFTVILCYVGHENAILRTAEAESIRRSQAGSLADDDHWVLTAAVGEVDEEGGTLSAFVANLRLQFAWFLTFLCVLALIAAACVFPSLISAFYLVVFLAVGTLWALETRLGSIIHSFSLLVCLVSAGHLVAFYLFQFQLMRDMVGEDNKWVERSGISFLVNSSCVNATDDPSSNSTEQHQYTEFRDDLRPPNYLNPIFVLVLYYLMSHHAVLWPKYCRSNVARRRLSSLIEHRSTVSGGGGGGNADMFSQIQAGIFSMYSKLKEMLDQNSYLVSVAVMILWSVWCHGIVALVLLIIAIYLWSRRNSRFRALNTAPFLFIYCPLYIFVQYVFNLDADRLDKYHSLNFTLNITDEFHPTINWADVRLSSELPMLYYLGAQCLFMIAFWGLMREFVSLHKEYSQRTAAAAAAATGGSHVVEVVTTGNSEISSASDESIGNEEWHIPDMLADRLTFNAITTTIIANKGKIKQMAAAVWMAVCIFTLIYVCTSSFPTAINVIYMLFFIGFVTYTLFKLSVSAEVPNFERFLRLILGYTMTVLLVTYICQFNFIFASFAIRNNNNYRCYLNEMGLYTEGISTSSTSVILPVAALLIVLKIQFDYFSDSFHAFVLDFSAQGPSKSEPGELIPRSEKQLKDLPRSKKLQMLIGRLKDIVLLFATMHIDKFFMVAILATCVHETNLINFLFMIIFVTTCLLRTNYTRLMLHIAFAFACIVVLAKMVYQNTLFNSMFDEDHLGLKAVNCSDVGDHDNLLWTNSTMLWVGLTVHDLAPCSAKQKNASATYIWRYLMIIIFALVSTLLRTRQMAKGKRLQQKELLASKIFDEAIQRVYKRRYYHFKFSNTYRALFPSSIRAKADRSFTYMARYLINFGFYKFGLEITSTVVLINCATNLNFFSLLYLLLLLPMVVIKREKLRFYVKIFASVTAICIVIKYGVILWFPPLHFVCEFGSTFLHTIEYGGAMEQSVQALRYWFFFPDFNTESASYELEPQMLVGDLFQLFFFKLLLRNLKEESDSYEVPEYTSFDVITPGQQPLSRPLKSFQEVAGNNKDCLDEPDRHRPKYLPKDAIKKRINYSRTNFLHDKKHLLNVTKSFIFPYSIWLTYSLVCITGLQRVDIFGLGFIGLAFYGLWLGLDISLYKRTVIDNRMKIILGYTLVSAAIKVLMTVSAFFCDYSVFSKPGFETFIKPMMDVLNVLVPKSYHLNLSHCDFVTEVIHMISWECACVVVVMVQKRIFLSHYYDFVMEDAVITRELADEGGRLIREFNRKDIEKAIRMRYNVRSRLERKIQSIKSALVQIHNWYEPVDHLDAIFNGARFFESCDVEAEPAGSPSISPNDSAADLEGNEDSKWDTYERLLKERLLGVPAGEQSLSEELAAKSSPSKKGKGLSSLLEESQSDEEDKGDQASMSVIDDSPAHTANTEVEPTRSQENPIRAEPAQEEAQAENETKKATEVKDKKEKDNKEKDKKEKDQKGKEATRKESSDDDKSEKEGETSFMERMRKLGAWLVYVLFYVFAEMGMVLDRGAAAFQRVIVCLDESRVAKLRENDDTRADTNVDGSMQEKGDIWGSFSVALPAESGGSSSAPEQCISRTESGSFVQRTRAEQARDRASSSVVSVYQRSSFSRPHVPAFIHLLPQLDEDLEQTDRSYTQELDNIEGYRFFVFFLRDFILSAYNFALSQTDYLCYFMMMLLLLMNGSLLDAILAVTSLLWGLLSKPRPSKRFWSLCIIYNACVILTRYVLQAKIFHYNNDGQQTPPWIVTIAGSLQNGDTYSSQLVLLVLLCFHRNILMNFGLWTDYKAGKEEQKYYVDGAADEERRAIHRSISDLAEKSHRADTTLLEVESSDECLRQSGSYNVVETAAQPPDEEPHASSDSPLLAQVGDADGQDDSDETERLPLHKRILNRLSKIADSFMKKSLDVSHEITNFVLELLDSNKTATRDVYTWMFTVDAISYLVVVFGYKGFSPGSDSIVALLGRNEVPLLFLGIMLMFFLFTLIDRFAYLTKNVTTKLIHFVVQVVFYNVWLVLINPGLTGYSFSENHSAQVLYFLRWIYWLFSAYQIKHSFPVRVLGNFFSKKYNLLNKLGMLVFFYAPFMFEIRVLMDWVFTQTTLTFFRWLEVEDVFVTTFILKCTRLAEKEEKRKRGETQAIFPQKVMYFLILVVLLAVIWCPILIFSFINQTKIGTQVTYATAKIQLSTFMPIFDGSQTGVANETWNQIQASGAGLPDIDESSNDFNRVTFNGDSNSIWTITPPSRDELISQLSVNDGERFPLYLTLSFSRTADSDSAANGFQASAVGIVTDYLSQGEQNQLAQVLNDTKKGCDKNATLTRVLPKYLTINNNGQVYPYGDKSQWTDLIACLNFTTRTPEIQWWVLNNGSSASNNFFVYTINEQVVPDVFSTVTSYGILGLYTVFVMLVATQLKSLLQGYGAKIVYNEMPDVTSIQQIVQEIYLCREMKQFELEEDLYSKLQYLYRSPETLIKETKYKVD